MSGLAVLFRRDGAPLGRDELHPVLDALCQRGADGSDSVHRGWFAMGHQHLWTTPEEVGERQPLSQPERQLDAVFDGRLDNRSELGNALGLGSAELAASSDAALALEAFCRWDTACFQRFLGPFVMVVVDPPSRRLVCARDPLGDRGLLYHLGDNLAVLASEERAVLRHPAVRADANESSLARFLALEVPLSGETFFARVSELPPGHTLVVTPERVELTRFFDLEGLPRFDYRSDDEYVEHLGHALAEAVRSRLRTVGPPAVLMSGGLDSTSVAALAAEQLCETHPDRPLITISWIFDELAQADEREFIEPMVGRHRLDAHLVPGDDAWPLSNLPTWPVNPNAPFEGLYRRLTERAYSRARSAGARSLLTGHFGDDLYTRWPDWLRDLLASGRPVEAWRRIAFELDGMSQGRRAALRTALGRALGFRPASRRTPIWLTPRAIEQGGLERAPRSRTPRRSMAAAAALVDQRSAHGTSRETANADRAGIDVRRPYRDLRLIALAASIPGHLLYRDGWSKWVLRQTMREHLPDEVRLRTRPSSLAPLCSRGLVEREQETVRQLLWNDDALWRRFVRHDWLESRVPDVFSVDGREAVAAWGCICLELWRRVYDGATSGSAQQQYPYRQDDGAR